MENSKIDYYSNLIHEKYSNKFDEDYIKFYLHTKRNYFIKYLIEYNRVPKMEIGESFDEIKTVNYYNKRFTEHIINYSDDTLNFEIKDSGIKINYSDSHFVKSNILRKLLVNFDVNSEVRINYNGIGIIKEIFNQQSILFGLNFNTYKLIYELIDKKSKEFNHDIQDKDNIEMYEDLFEMMQGNENEINKKTQRKPTQEDIYVQKVVNEILSICINNKVNQDEIILEL
jgi:hypothetical protein